MLKFLLYTALAFILLIIYIRYIEAKSIFFPMKKVEFTPAFVNLSFEDIYINTPDGAKINGWFIPKDKAKYTILFCHGNAGNIGHRLEKIAIFHHEIGVNIFIIDYRGYGNSTAKPSEKGIYLDAKAAYDYLINIRKAKPEDIILYGESLGCAAAINLASKEKIAALISESGFSSAKDMAGMIYPFLPSFVFSSRLDSLSRIDQVAAPKLFIHSRNDEIVPYELAMKLYNAAIQPKEFIELIGGHNTAFLDSKEKYILSITKFIGNLNKK